MHCRKLNSNVILLILILWENSGGEYRSQKKRSRVVWPGGILALKGKGREKIEKQDFAFLVKPDIKMQEMIFKLYMCLILYSAGLLTVSEV